MTIDTMRAILCAHLVILLVAAWFSETWRYNLSVTADELRVLVQYARKIESLYTDWGIVK